MTKLCVLAAAASALVLAAPAGAKGPVSAKLCGEDVCTTITDAGVLRGITQDDGGAPPPSADSSRSYAVNVTFRGDQEVVDVRFRYHPDLQLKEWDDGTWTRVSDEHAPLFTGLIGRVDAPAGGRSFEWWWLAVAAAATAVAAAAAVLWRRRGRVLAPRPESA